jgi:16S rRNA (uracil1498-N3)-methyltransferase
MSEPRIYVDMDLAAGLVMSLPEEAYRHLVIVLRRIPGDAVTLFNGRGGEYAAKVESVAKRNLTVRIEEFRAVERESPLPVTLAQAVSKGEHMDYSIQKAVELGVGMIQPLITDHVVVRLNAERWARKQEHWQGVVNSACEQCGRNRVPAVATPVALVEAVQAASPGLNLVLTPAAEAESLGTLFARHGKPGKLPPVTLLIGPEGGLDAPEVSAARLAGFVGCRLGPRVLRTETAALAALAALQSVAGDFA